MDSLYDRAIIVANKSRMNQRHACFIVHNGRVLSEGFNYLTEHFHHKYSIHAEVATLMKLKHLPKSVLKECHMFVFRVSRSNEFRMSKPCADCEKAIKDANISRIYYTCDAPVLTPASASASAAAASVSAYQTQDAYSSHSVATAIENENALTHTHTH